MCATLSTPCLISNCLNAYESESLEACGVLNRESAYILRQQTAWERDESEGKDTQSLVFGAKILFGGKQEVRILGW